MRAVWPLSVVPSASDPKTVVRSMALIGAPHQYAQAMSGAPFEPDLLPGRHLQAMLWNMKKHPG